MVTQLLRGGSHHPLARENLEWSRNLFTQFLKGVRLLWRRLPNETSWQLSRRYGDPPPVTKATRSIMLILLAIAIARPLSALAGMPEWLEAERRGDWPALVREYEAAARRGNATAMYNLSLSYYEGRGVQRDDRMCLLWAAESAKRGFAPAMHLMGVLYDEGKGGVQRNLAEAFRWFLAAANAGYPDSMFNVGQMYITGQGTAANYVEGYVWTKLSSVTPKPAGSKMGSSDAIANIERNLKVARRRMSRAELARAENLFVQRQAALHRAASSAAARSTKR